MSTDGGRDARNSAGWSLRLAEADDARAIADIYRPIVESSATSFESVPPDHEEMAGRIRATLPRYPWLVLETPGGIAGYAYGGSHRAREAYRFSVETSVYVAGGFRGRGIGRALYDSLIAILTAQGYANVYTGIALPNPASVALHEALGFRPIGTFRRVGFKAGAWHDVGWWHLSLRPPADHPAPPRRLDELARDAAWAGLVATGLRHLDGSPLDGSPP